MPTLTLPEIVATCGHVVNRSKLYQPLQWIAFLTLQRTGCREGEVCDLSRWTLTNVGTYELVTEKGAGIRTFDAVELPLEFRQWIANRKDGRAPTSVDRLRSAFRQMSTWRRLSVGRKGISTHLFRYAYIRSLQAEGFTVPEIKARMALSSTTVVNNYLSNPVEGQ